MWLPGVLVCILLTGWTEAGHVKQQPPPPPANPVPEQIQDTPCPGECTTENNCGTFLNETDCPAGLVCCVDNFEKISTTEFADWDLPMATEGTPELSPDEEAEAESVSFVTEADLEGSSIDYANVQNIEYEQQETEAMGCPGKCMPTEMASACEYVIQSESVCSTNFVCCLTASEADSISQQYGLEIEDSVPRKRHAEMLMECPGSCVHPSHAMFCEQVLPQYHCPLNARCCIKRAAERSFPTSVECKGQCLAENLLGYCLPPNEMVFSSNCPPKTTCCMRRPSEVYSKPPTVNRMQFPSLQQSMPPQPQVPQNVLGHLAVDDSGTVFKVATSGQIFPLPRLTQADHMRTTYTRITSYQRPNGEIAIYADQRGGLYQQFFPNQSFMRVPQDQAQQSLPDVSEPQSPESDEPKDENTEDIVIPDDDDVPVAPPSKPIVHDDKNSNPPCPGSCMSYFLRFTCYRGYAIYDGFTCPGRAVCCARLQDIEEQEAYLKSLSPYFNTPPSTRGQEAPRCGIKGASSSSVAVRDSNSREWCWQVAIINVQNQYICGGALIDNSWVLTAGHCVFGPSKENQAIFVRVGVSNLKSPEDNNKGQTIRVLSTFIHHNFNSKNLDNNIALLRLQKPAELGPSTCVVCLPTRGQMPAEGSKCTVTGYGFISHESEMALHIKEAKIPIADDMECMANVTEALNDPFILPASSFCAGGQDQEDVCQGDAGGPLTCEVDGFHELVGILSWSLGCSRNDVPSIYVKVPSFMGWINQIISSSSFLISLH